jgi:hypothetical protein
MFPLLGPHDAKESFYSFETLKDFFLQDERRTKDGPDFDFVCYKLWLKRVECLHFAQTTTNFGLIDRAYPTDDEFDPDQTKTTWERLVHYIGHLDKISKPTESIRLLFLGRHGEGWHNLKVCTLSFMPLY